MSSNVPIYVFCRKPKQGRQFCPLFEADIQQNWSIGRGASIHPVACFKQNPAKRETQQSCTIGLIKHVHLLFRSLSFTQNPTKCNSYSISLTQISGKMGTSDIRPAFIQPCVSHRTRSSRTTLLHISNRFPAKTGTSNPEVVRFYVSHRI